MSNHVFVLDTNRKPLTPCTPGTARSLLKAGKAAVFRRYPFTIILKKEVDADPEPIELKLDPGSKVAGIALKQGNQIIFGAELQHRGQQIKNALLSRHQLRRSRRRRKTRYRQARFLNRTRSPGWLAPSLRHRVDTVLAWVNRFRKLAPIGSIAMELVKFDLQQMQNPEISGVEYQQGELQGFEVKEYLLEKFNHHCAYCGVKDAMFEVEHVIPRSKGGSDRVSNLALACHDCNEKKASQDVRDFLSGKPDVLKRVLAQIKTPLKDAAAVNSTRWALLKALRETGLLVATSSGGRTKFNRKRLGLPKTHWLDAACVGNVSDLQVLTNQPLLIKAMGHGNRQMIQNDKYGFPRKRYEAKRKVKGWNTGDIVSVINGKFAGIISRLKTVRFKGSFDIRLDCGKVVSVSRNHIKAVHRNDGYNYSFARICPAYS